MSLDLDKNDEIWMRRALSLAEKGIFSAAPNPCVGCVLVKAGHVIGEGFHVRAGQAHAEIIALNQAGSQAAGATAYVTLEPCAHFGRTPPCVDALIQAGIVRVVIAICDNNPLVSGKSVKKLRQAGILVTTNVLREAAQQLNHAFFYRMQYRRPWVTLKLAASMDGRTALASGESQWITSKAAREDVHFHRLRADAVIAGTGSIIHDNARLTARYTTELPTKLPVRVIIDSQLQTPSNAALFDDLSPIWLITTQNTTPCCSYPSHAEIIPIPANLSGKVDLVALLNFLGAREINHAFIEAGASLGGALLESELVNEILLYLSPAFLGNDAQPLVKITPLQQLSDRICYTISDARAIGDDWRFTLVPKT